MPASRRHTRHRAPTNRTYPGRLSPPDERPDGSSWHPGLEAPPTPGTSGTAGASGAAAAGAPPSSWPSPRIASAPSARAAGGTPLSDRPPAPPFSSPSPLRQVAPTCLFSEGGRREPGTGMEPRVSPGGCWRGAAQQAAADAEGSPASASAPARLSPTSSRGPPKGPPREIDATQRAAASSRRAGPAKPRPPRRGAHHCHSPPPAPPIGRLPLWRHRGPAHPSVSMTTGVNRGPHGVEPRGMQGAELPENLEGLTAACLPALRTLEGVRQVGGFGEGGPRERGLFESLGYLVNMHTCF